MPIEFPNTFAHDNVCPYCSAHFYAATALVRAEDRPSKGSANICSRCGEISIFDEDGSLRRATSTERAEIIAQFLRMTTPKVV